MTKVNTGYQITKEDITSAIKYLTYVEKMKNPTKKDAIAFLQKKHALVHLTAHKIVEDEQTGKIDPIKLKG
jgi:hypothetical protein